MFDGLDCVARELMFLYGGEIEIEDMMWWCGDRSETVQDDAPFNVLRRVESVEDILLTKGYEESPDRTQFILPYGQCN